MEQELRAQIEELTKKRDDAQAELDAAVQKFNEMTNDVPEVYRNMDQATFDKLKKYFN